MKALVHQKIDHTIHSSDSFKDVPRSKKIFTDLVEYIKAFPLPQGGSASFDAKLTA